MTKQASDLFIVDNSDADWKVRSNQRIVVALKETIRLKAEIDWVIEANGGWPESVQTARDIAINGA